MSPPVTLPGDLPGLLRRCAPVHRDGHFGVVSGDFPADGTVPESVADLELDLSDPVGRDIAARWLAERLGLEVGWTAPTFEFVDGNVTGGPSGWALTGNVNGSSFFKMFVPIPTAQPFDCDIVVPGLTLDRTKGPEALARICLHVAGRRTA